MLQEISRLAMAVPKKEKHSSNRAHRHSEVVIWQASKPKKRKPSESPSRKAVVAQPGKRKCPFRFVLAAMMESGEKKDGCPLRRVQLWHVIPLVLFAIVNLVLVIIALFGLAGYRVAVGLQKVVGEWVKADLDCDPYAESDASSDTLVSSKH